ncbi:S1C family serine protease [Botrimarina hoheduenensis]|uniref:S1C family serine protease n=1 Tax=Botrimarina hoheduenensis TaxID=2528000 RepID=UPI0018D4A8E9|nr:trypsin-like peptidase domain-containing protein [Botrimarina hoheduenensis]
MSRFLQNATPDGAHTGHRRVTRHVRAWLAAGAMRRAAGVLGLAVGVLGTVGIAAAEKLPKEWYLISAEYPPTARATALAIEEPLAAKLKLDRPGSLDELRAVQAQVRRVVELATPATVSVELSDSLGSGVIISSSGLVLTAGHVTVEPKRPLWVRLPDGRRYRGRSLGVNHRVDSGLVKITADPPAGGWPSIPVADNAAQAGDWVIALGHPNGFVKGRLPPLRLGRVQMLEDCTLSTDATLVGGDSGGPLLNLRGEVVGIHSRIGERITSNFHVPIKEYREDWPRLVEGRMTGVPDGEDPAADRPLVGVSLTSDARGPLVSQVFPGSPAAEAGLQVGDRVVGWNDEPIQSLAQLTRLAALAEPYQRVQVLVERAGESPPNEANRLENGPPQRLNLVVWLTRVDRRFPGLASESSGSQAGSGSDAYDEDPR